MAIIKLKEYLRNVYGELKNYLEGLSEEERREFVRGCHDMFEGGTADYSDRYTVAFYILKYARAYGFQFSRAYADIFSDMEHPESVKVTSIGCGTGIDYWGMSYAARILCRDAECDIDYTGIDPQVWPFRISDVEDMPEQDVVRYNTVDIRTQGGNEEHNDQEECDDFGKYLSIMETNTDEPIDDIYFFAHSIKEVCIHTVQGNQETGRLFSGGGYYDVYKYNAYQSMARFSRLIRERIGDKPVYVAFTYRRVPDENIADTIPHEAYDVKYGTFFRTCLMQRGLNVEMLAPFDIDVRGCRSLCTYESDEICRESYFDYDEFHTYIGTPEDESKIWRLQYDARGSFDSFFNDTRRRNYNSEKICDRPEWYRFFCNADGINEYPMDSVENMCYQVFKISADQVAGEQTESLQEKNKWLDILEEALRDFEFSIEYGAERLDIFVNKLRQHINRNEAQVKGIYERITGERLNDIRILTDMLNINTIVYHIADEGYVDVQDPDDEGIVRYTITEKGKKAGFVVRLADNDKIIVTSYAQQNIVANIICGRYIDWGNRI